MRLCIKAKRESLGLTQSELAKKIGKSFRTIQSWERGESYPNAEAIWELSVVFGIDPNELMGWYEEHPEDRNLPSYVDPGQEALNGYFESMNSDGRRALVESARLMSGSPDTRIEKEGAESAGVSQALGA